MKPKQPPLFMHTRTYSAYLVLILLIVFSSCATQKKRASKKTYHAQKSHNTTSKPNSKADYFNFESSGSTTSSRASEGKKPADRVLTGRENVSKTEEQLFTFIHKARSFTGVPYAWGGTTRAGMDCSGLLYTTFQSCGMSIPRTSAAQSQVGEMVSMHELRPGDFVFFAAQKGKPRKITHVGMVTEVLSKHNVQFIHASTKLGVVENNIYGDYYRRIFVKARRLF